MVKKLLIFALPLMFFILPNYVHGHGSGLPQFFKINGKIPEPNPLQTAGILPTSFSTAQDLPADNYLVNQNIDFIIDKNILETVFSPSVLEKTKFSWDFGDGTKVDGLVNSHKYAKAGSYTLEINADFAQPEIPTQLVESAQINVLPDANYQLPRAVIKVNDKKFDGNPQNANINIDLTNTISLDASLSQALSSKIVEYIWDFSDGESSKDTTANHKYKLPQYYATPALRVKDENGFISDTFVSIKNSGNNVISSAKPESTKPGKLTVVVIIITTILTAVTFIGFLKKKK